MWLRKQKGEGGEAHTFSLWNLLTTTMENHVHLQNIENDWSIDRSIDWLKILNEVWRRFKYFWHHSKNDVIASFQILII